MGSAHKIKRIGIAMKLEAAKYTMTLLVDNGHNDEYGKEVDDLSIKYGCNDSADTE